jgi:protein-tyrosine phosphatase
MSTILVVCTGNICRSPIAEGFLRQLLEDRRIDGVSVESAGVSGLRGYPADPEAVRAAAEQGVDISRHLARRVKPQTIEEADLVLAMTAEQRDAVIARVPAAAGRTFTLKELVYLLEKASGDSPDRSVDERLANAAARANALRESEPGLELLDEDVSDPLGLGPDAFRATVWEVGQLLERFADKAFGSEDKQPVGETRGGSDEGLRG